jgi:hypothetical protein
VWSPYPETYAAILSDPTSGRRTVIRRPTPDRLPMDDLVRLESLAFRWVDPPTQTPAQAELFGALDTDPLRVLNGMNWLLAYWAVLWDLRNGDPATELIQRLDYTSPWREGGAPIGATEHDHVWKAITQRIRSGVLAQLTGEPRLLRAYDSEVIRLAPDVYLHITLATVDGLSRDLTEQGLRLNGMAAALAEHTGPGDGDLPPFGRPE